MLQKTIKIANHDKIATLMIRAVFTAKLKSPHIIITINDCPSPDSRLIFLYVLQRNFVTFIVGKLTNFFNIYRK